MSDLQTKESEMTNVRWLQRPDWEALAKARLARINAYGWVRYVGHTGRWESGIRARYNRKMSRTSRGAWRRLWWAAIRMGEPTR